MANIKPFKKLFLCAISALFATFALAQPLQTITGNITDLTKQPLEMVSVALLRPADSSLAHFGVTDKTGNFSIKNVAVGRYIFQSAYIGHATVMMPIEVSANGVAPSIAQIVMEAQSNVLSEIIIEGQRIPIIINRDTVSYNTDAFQVRSDETAEDLLRRLPGIDVDARGKITAQGEEVKKVLVDGKEFFGGNVQLVTQNLPADAIKNVKVYDRESDDAMYTGVADGQRTKTIDLELKEDKKNGYFGDVEGGIGTDERFRGRAGFHAFSPKTRFSVLTNTNNLNQYGFNWNDMMAMAGNEAGGGYISWDSDANPIPMGFMGPSEGVFTSSANGVNFNYDPNKNHMLNANYYLTYYDHLQTTQTQSEEFNDLQSVQFDENRNLRNIRMEHRGYLEYRWDIDSNNRVHLRSSLNSTNSNNRNRFLSDGRTQEGANLQRSQQFGNAMQQVWQGKTTLHYTHKFKKEQRNLATRLAADYSDDVTDESYQATNDFPLQQLSSFLYQFREDRVLQNTYTGSVRFTEPIAKNHNISLRINANQTAAKQERFVRNVGEIIFIDSLSPQNLLMSQNLGASVSYSYQTEEDGPFSFGASLNGQQYNWQLQFPSGIGKMTPRQIAYLMPEVWVQYENNGANSYLSIDRDARLPGMFQLVQNPDLRNPLNVVLGNLDLMPELSTNVYGYFYKYNQNTQGSWSANLNMSRVDNPFVYAQSIDENFRRTSQVINGDAPNYRASASTRTRFLIEKALVFLNPGVSYTYNDFNAPVNGVNNRQTNHSYGASMSISNSRKQKWDLSAKYEFQYNQSFYSVFDNLNQTFTSQNVRLAIQYRLGEKWTFATDFNYQYFSEQAFAGAVGIPLLNAVVTYKPQPKGNWSFKINAFDLMNQNQSITRLANANFIRQVENNLLTRYFLVTATYKIKKR